MEYLKSLASTFASWADGDGAAAAFAGAAGGLVRWLTLRENWRDGLVSLVVGSVCAIFLGPLAAPMLRPFVGAISPGSNADGFSSFVVGLGGIGLAGFVIEALRLFRTRRPAPPAPPYHHQHRRPPDWARPDYGRPAARPDWDIEGRSQPDRGPDGRGGGNWDE